MKFAVLLALVMLMLTGAAHDVDPAASSDRPEVERVSIAEMADGRGYVLRLHTSGRIPAYSEPRRTSGTDLEMMLFNTALARGARKDSPSGPVASYGLNADGNHLKLQLSLQPNSPVMATVYRDRDTPDLLVALSLRSDARPVASNQRPSASTPERGETARVSSGERWRLDKIVIDAGHGGKDAGAVANGVREKDIVLAVAKKLGQYIQDNLDMEVVYTRTDDRFIELRDRGRIANEAGAKLFVSIHANSARNRGAYGTETFFLGPSKTEAARRVMETENRVVEMESNPEHYEQMNEASLIRQTLAHSSYVRNSQELADIIEHQFSDRVGRQSRGVKQAPFYVLWSASMPAVLVELGFLTNPREAAFLASDQGQTYIASAIFRAVRQYKEQYERGLNLVRTE